MNDLNYELWQEMIEHIASEYADLFSIMHQAARELPLSRALIDDLKTKKELLISTDPWRMVLQIDLIEDDRIYLMTSVERDALEDLMSETAEELGITQEEIDAFEVDHGLDMLGDVFEKIRDEYGIQPEIQGGNIIFSLLVFDSQDIDDCMGNDIFWSEDVQTN